MKQTFIYALREPTDAEIRYVGKTNKPRVRLKLHLYAANRHYNNPQLYRWIEDLKSRGERPLLTVLERCNEGNWCDKEKEWISFLRKSGAPLLNISEGGAGPTLGQVRSHSEEAKRLLREANRLQFANPQKRQKHREGVDRWWRELAEEERNRLMEIGSNALSKPEVKEKQRKSVRKFWSSMTPEEKQKFIMERSAKRQAVKLSDEGKSAVKRGCLKAWSDPVRKAERLKKYLASRYGR